MKYQNQAKILKAAGFFWAGTVSGHRKAMTPVYTILRSSWRADIQLTKSRSKKELEELILRVKADVARIEGVNRDRKARNRRKRFAHVWGGRPSWAPMSPQRAKLTAIPGGKVAA